MLFIINCKNYYKITEESISKLSKIIQVTSKKYRVKIAIAPPFHLLTIATKYFIPVFAQHMDNMDNYNSTGFIIPKLLKKSKILGSLINHSEHRISSNNILEITLKLKKLDMVSVICVEKISEVKKYVQFNPTYIAIEPKNLIGTGRSITNENPDVIIKSLKILKRSNVQTKLLCGAGISDENDVKKAVQLGTHGILVSSRIINAKNWKKIIDKFTNAIL